MKKFGNPTNLVAIIGKKGYIFCIKWNNLFYYPYKGKILN